ncbi:type IV pilus modification PilV family protein [Alteromonas gilva]|uniref:Prepilin-type N-terminal cleavage/methylation domain-containing protein n=1 Tax=Alteromonas gilva TaxID=2987522 RepID=A0ABT5L1Z6_9ALTE|nr:prepilin-type N-terminal cleavage/methylation domain-containing protein [Alteromonas gilva]MDC8829882.1 prepilin-type N-terminal cleavage/methylation domain-containing protein [Alteromonas gilva]
MKAKQQGLTLIEALITMLVASVGLLSLAAAQLKSLQYAHNSFNYTIALVEGNNAVETIWPDINNFFDGSKPFNSAYTDSLSTYPSHQLQLNTGTPGTLCTNFPVTVSWADERLQDGNVNAAVIEASFPNLTGVPSC